MVTRKILKNYLYTHYIYIKVKEEKKMKKKMIYVCVFTCCIITSKTKNIFNEKNNKKCVKFLFLLFHVYHFS